MGFYRNYKLLPIQHFLPESGAEGMHCSTMIPAGNIINFESVAAHSFSSNCVLNTSTVGKTAAEVDTECNLSHQYFTCLSSQHWLFTLLFLWFWFGFVLFLFFLMACSLHFVRVEYVMQNLCFLMGGLAPFFDPVPVFFL